MEQKNHFQNFQQHHTEINTLSQPALQLSSPLHTTQFSWTLQTIYSSLLSLEILYCTKTQTCIAASNKKDRVNVWTCAFSILEISSIWSFNNESCPSRMVWQVPWRVFSYSLNQRKETQEKTVDTKTVSLAKGISFAWVALVSATHI